MYLHSGHRKTRYTMYKKLSCRRETARCLMSLNILLTHSRSLKVIRNDRCYVHKKRTVVNAFLRYLSLNNDVTLNCLKFGFGVVQGH